MEKNLQLHIQLRDSTEMQRGKQGKNIEGKKKTTPLRNV